jgi:hypothetical protein
MLNAVLFVVGYLALLCLGGAMLAWGLLLSTHARFQRWDYHRTEKKWPDENSKEYQTAQAHMRISGARAGLMGGLLVVFALAQLGVLH